MNWPLVILENRIPAYQVKVQRILVKAVRYITYMNVYQNQIINATNVGLVKINGAEQQSVVHYGDILLLCHLKQQREVGIGAVYLGDTYPLYLNSFCFGIHIIDDNKIFPPFLAFYGFNKVV